MFTLNPRPTMDNGINSPVASERCTEPFEQRPPASALLTEESPMCMSTPENCAESVDKNRKAGRRRAPTRHQPRVTRPGPHRTEHGGFLAQRRRRLRRSHDSTRSRQPGSSMFPLSQASRDASPHSSQHAPGEPASRHEDVETTVRTEWQCSPDRRRKLRGDRCRARSRGRWRCSQRWQRVPGATPSGTGRPRTTAPDSPERRVPRAAQRERLNKGSTVIRIGSAVPPATVAVGNLPRGRARQPNSRTAPPSTRRRTASRPA